MAEEYKQEMINRLKSIEGHVRGIQRMLEEDAYCIDIMNQNLAVQRASSSSMRCMPPHPRAALADLRYYCHPR